MAAKKAPKKATPDDAPSAPASKSYVVSCAKHPEWSPGHVPTSAKAFEEYRKHERATGAHGSGDGNVVTVRA